MTPEDMHVSNSYSPASERQELFQRIRLLIQIRWFSAIGILVIVLQEAILKAAVPGIIGKAGIIFAIVVTLNVIYSKPILRSLQGRSEISVRLLWAFLIVQLIIDVGLMATAIHLSGGIDSDYKFLMILTPLVAALVIPSAGVALIATCAVAAYFAVLYLEYRGILSHHVLAHRGSTERFADLAHVVADFGILFGLIAVCCSIVIYLNMRLQKSRHILRLSRKELALLKDRYRRVIEQAQDGIFLIDKDATIRLCNNKGEEILKNVTGTSRVSSLKELFRPEDRPVFLGRIAQMLADPCDHSPTQMFELSTQRGPDSRDPRILLFSVAPISAERATPEILCIARDITDQRRLESQQIISEKMTAMGILAAGLSHEFSNLLASIRGYAQLAQQHMSDQSLITTALHVIEEQTTRGKEFIERLNRFSFPYTKGEEVVDLGDLLREVFALIQNQLRNEHIEVALQSSEPALVFGDKNQLRHAFLNLAVNARHAILPKGKGTISVQITNAPAEVLIAFSDSGIGMTKEEVRHAFEPFFTTKGPLASGPTMHEEGGHIGLGLSLVYTTVRAHGGSIQLESEFGQGTTFLITLPRVSQEKHARPESPFEADRHMLANTHTLLAVEDPTMSQLLEQLIRTQGGFADTVTRAAAILDTLERHSYDFLYLQESLPGTNIQDLLYEIRRSFPYVKVALVCEQAPSEYKLRLLKEAGALAVLTKPLHLSEIASVFCALLDDKRGGRPLA